MTKKNKLYRQKEDKVLAGLLSGLGYYFKIDPNLLRLAFVFISFFGLFAILAYIVLWFVIPYTPKDYHHTPYRVFHKSQSDKKIGGICGGLAEYFKLNSILVRIVFLVLGFITGIIPLVIIYFVACILFPYKTKKDIDIEIAKR